VDVKNRKLIATVAMKNICCISAFVHINVTVVQKADSYSGRQAASEVERCLQPNGRSQTSS